MNAQNNAGLNQDAQNVQLQVQYAGPPPLPWSPPVIIEDFGRKARAVTQADVDRWIAMEMAYDVLRMHVDDMHRLVQKREE